MGLRATALDDPDLAQPQGRLGGYLDDEDKQANDDALKRGLIADWKIYCITAADRGSTTLLLAQETRISMADEDGNGK